MCVSRRSCGKVFTQILLCRQNSFITTETKNTPLSPKFIIILDALHGYKSEMFSKGVMLILYIYPFIFVTFPVELHHVYCKYKVMP